MDADDVIALTDAAASGPTSASRATAGGGSQSMSQQPLADLIELERHRKAQQVTARTGQPGIRFFQLVPPGGG